MFGSGAKSTMAPVRPVPIPYRQHAITQAKTLRLALPFDARLQPVIFAAGDRAVR